MAFNDFSMVLTVVVFCNFFSVLHHKVTAFVCSNKLMLSCFKYHIIKTQQAWKSIVLKLCGYAAAFRHAWCWGEGVWTHKWGGGCWGVRGCRNITGLHHWSMPSSITLCYTPTRVSNRCRLKSFTNCDFCSRFAAPDFVMKCSTEATAVRWPEVWKFYGSLTVLHFPTRGANDAHNVRV